jgi:hypothetical protein
MMANAIYIEKLSIVDNYLLVSGWKESERHDGYWVTPKHIRHALRFRHRAPEGEELCFKRSQAVAFQVLADEAAMTAIPWRCPNCGEPNYRNDDVALSLECWNCYGEFLLLEVQAA